MPNKVRLLQAIADYGPIENPKELVVFMNGLGVHATVHLIWSCQKLGLLTFKQVKSDTRTIPSKITITQKGREWLARQA